MISRVEHYKQLSMNFIAFHLFLSFTLFLPLIYGADTLVMNQSLSGDQTLVSLAGNFEVGFFKPGKLPKYYIGIWYKNVKTPTIVWVANRETPIVDRFSSKLKIEDGNLVLLNELNATIWSTNMVSSTTKPASLVLLDDGNLVLRYGSSSSQPIWQSFDHPTHTFLPGSKLGYNKRTNTTQVITSWKNIEDPAPGLFSLEIDEKEKEYVLKWNRSVEYWSSGPWNGQYFASVPEMYVPYIFSFSYIDNANESYFTYSFNSSVISRLVIEVSGQIQQMTWKESSEQWFLFWSQPGEVCDIYAKCGAFSVCVKQVSPFCNCLTGFQPTSQSDWDLNEFSGGCVRKTDLKCRIQDEQPEFILSYVDTKFLPTFHKNETTSLLDETACRRSCLDDCSCEGYSFILEVCHFWSGENLNNISLAFVSNDSSVEKSELNLKVASKDLQHPIKNIHKKNSKVNLGVVFGSIAAALLVLGLFFLITYRKMWVRVGKTRMEGSLVAYAYRDLQRATKNFTTKLGSGGFGSVFKGVLHDSSVVAVKKLESVNQGEKQFRSEVSTIGTIQHVNLVHLRGFCAQGSNKMLVYDYMPNGSLDSHLFHAKQDNTLNWKTRYEIAIGIARGLVYLHEKCRDCIIHCDIKPENILLDTDFCPKITDFGLAKLVGRDFSRVLTTMRGTRGYLAPEWLSGVPVTAKADVYSYGMLLFELVSGKRNLQQFEGSSFTFFPSLALNIVMDGGDILSLLDSRLNGEASVEEVTRICKVAYWCIQDEEDSRPSMSQVEHILKGVVDVNMPPIPLSVKFFIDGTEDVPYVPLFDVSSSIFNESSSTGSSQVHNDSLSIDSQSKSVSS